MRFWQYLLDFILPPRCTHCGGWTSLAHTLCSSCWTKSTFITSPYCTICGWPLPYEASYCAPCSSRPPLFNQGRSIFYYEGTIRSLILKLKDHDATYIAPSLALFLHRFGGDIFDNLDGMIPIPLHRWRFVYRGYNQTSLIAHHLAKYRPVPVQMRILRRYRSTTRQTKLPGSLRRSNVKNAFVLTSYGQRWIPHKRVLLIDDVWTTGATLEECTKMLINHGAREVKALTVARVIPF